MRAMIPSESERFERISAVLTYYDQIFSAQIILNKHFQLSENKRWIIANWNKNCWINSNDTFICINLHVYCALCVHLLVILFLLSVSFVRSFHFTSLHSADNAKLRDSILSRQMAMRLVLQMGANSCCVFRSVQQFNELNYSSLELNLGSLGPFQNADVMSLEPHHPSLHEISNVLLWRVQVRVNEPKTLRLCGVWRVAGRKQNTEFWRNYDKRLSSHRALSTASGR